MIVTVRVGAIACRISTDEDQQGPALDEMASVAQAHVVSIARELAEAGLTVIECDEDD